MLLLLGAALDDGAGEDLGPGDERAAGAERAPRELLGRDAHREVVGLAAGREPAVLLGDREPEPAELGHALDDRPRGCRRSRGGCARRPAGSCPRRSGGRCRAPGRTRRRGGRGRSRGRGSASATRLEEARGRGTARRSRGPVRAARARRPTRLHGRPAGRRRRRSRRRCRRRRATPRARRARRTRASRGDPATGAGGVGEVVGHDLVLGRAWRPRSGRRPSTARRGCAPRRRRRLRGLDGGGRRGEGFVAHRSGSLVGSVMAAEPTDATAASYGPAVVGLVVLGDGAVVADVDGRRGRIHHRGRGRRGRRDRGAGAAPVRRPARAVGAAARAVGAAARAVGAAARPAEPEPDAPEPDAPEPDEPPGTWVEPLVTSTCFGWLGTACSVMFHAASSLRRPPWRGGRRRRR